jgi:hypothetical protein
VHRPKEVVVRGGRNVDEIKKKISVRLPDSVLDERKRVFDQLPKRYGYWTVRTLGEFDREVYKLGLRGVLKEAEKQGSFGME